MQKSLARVFVLATFAASVWLGGCGGHEARTLQMRTALDAGDPKRAIASLNDEMDVSRSTDLPADLEGDNSLLVLDRASIQQSLADFKSSKRDFQAADKAIDMLDLARNAGDTIGEYVFSDSAGRYKAPPYEKLLVNTMNMLNYLELRDLSGARVEARRLSVMQRYIVDKLGEKDNTVVALGGYLAGFVFEKSGNYGEAARYYDEALKVRSFDSLGDPIARVLAASAYTSPRLKGAATKDRSTSGPPPSRDAPSDVRDPLPVAPPPAPAAGDSKSPNPSPESTPAPAKPRAEARPPWELGPDEGEILVIVGYGRVPHKIAKRIPIGLALTLFADSIHPKDRVAANKLAAQGLVTWVNYPSLGREQGAYGIPDARLDGRAIDFDGKISVSSDVRRQWKSMEGKIVASAISRMIARLLVGEGIQQAAGKDSLGGFLASLGAQAALTALDTPDTRSWETLPARVVVARKRVKAGRHTVRLSARGVVRTQEVVVPKGGWRVVSLMALR